MTTPKGRATRDRIVAVAAGLMFEHGVGGTSTEDVQVAAGVSASQIYHYFDDKRALTHAVIEYWSDAILGFHDPMFARLDDVDGLREWAKIVVDVQRSTDFRGGCPLGSLASELAGSDDAARDDLVAGYRRWHAAICGGLANMQARGELDERADPDQLATALLTALQGGLLLSKTLRNGEALHVALNTVIDQIETFVTTPSI